MERQLLIGQLPILLQQRTAQHCFGGQALPPSGLYAAPDQIASHQAEQIAMLIQPLRHGLQLIADLVCRETSNMLAWTVRSWRIVGSGGGRTWNQ
jgi:hypothetical protein